MEKDIIIEMTNLYDSLIENGVVFYYGSEIIPHGEITSMVFKEDNIIEIELNGYETYEIESDEFVENHTKSGVNYHSWETVRIFDKLLGKK